MNISIIQGQAISQTSAWDWRRKNLKFSEFFWSQNLAGIINCCGAKVEIGADNSAGEQIVITNANITTSLFSEINEVLIWLLWDATELLSFLIHMGLKNAIIEKMYYGKFFDFRAQICI